MAYRIRRVEYFTTTVHDQPGEAYKLLSQLADLGLNLVAFTAVPVGPLHAQLTSANTAVRAQQTTIRFILNLL